MGKTTQLFMASFFFKENIVVPGNAFFVGVCQKTSVIIPYVASQKEALFVCTKYFPILTGILLYGWTGKDDGHGRC